MRIKGCEPEGRSESGVFVNRESATIPPAESEERETGRGTACSAPTGRRIEGDSQPPIGIPDLTAKVKHSKNRSLLFITSDKLKLPVSIRVPFAGGFHSYTGVLDDASIGCQGIRLTGPTFASGIEGHSLRTASIVSSFSGRSHKTTLEFYGNDGLPIAQFRGSHNVREYAVWQDIMNSLVIEIV